MKTDWKEDILAPSMQGKRRYHIYENEDASVSFVDSTQYDQVGDVFGATELNQIGEEINNTVNMLTSAVQTAQDSAESAQASADRAMQGTPEGYEQLVQDVADTKKSVSDGKKLVADAITEKGVETATDATFATMATNISAIETGVDTSDATAEANNILYGKTAYVNGEKVTGTMANKSGSTVTSNTVTSDDDYTYLNVPSAGYYDTNSKIATLNSNLGKNYVFKKSTFSSSNGYTNVNISGVKKVLAVIVSNNTSLGNSGIFGTGQTVGNFNGTQLLYNAGLGANNAYGVTELGIDKFVFRWDAVYTWSYIALCES